MPAMVMLQAVMPSAVPAVPLTLSLPASRAVRPCSFSDDRDIVICGRRDTASRYRLPPPDTTRFEPRRRAETMLTGDLKGAAEVESREIAPGMTSNRIMVRLKLPF